MLGMKLVKPLLPLAAAAVIGGGAGAVATTALHDDSPSVRTVTTTRTVAASPSDSATALSPHDVYQSAKDSVAYITTGSGTGSGFVVSNDGYIVTNAHVIEGANGQIKAKIGDGKTLDAKLVGEDASTDLALLKVTANGLKPLQLADSSSVEVGDDAYAIGNPFGLDRTLTVGVVSALQRQIQAPIGFAINDVIQTDAAINPGNSGGPLIDAAGRVIGINSQIETGGSSNGNVGIGFAVPIDTAKKILDQLKKSGSVQRAYLGISSLTVDGSLDALDLPVKQGALVQRVESGSPAAKAGLKAGDITAQVAGQQMVLGGDIVTQVDGRPVRSADQLSQVISGHKPGDKVKLSYVRDGKERTTTVELGKRPSTLQVG